MTTAPQIEKPSWEELHRLATHGRVRPPEPARLVGHRLRTEPSASQTGAASEPLNRRTEDGFAVDFVTYCAGRIAYIAELGSWYAWDGHVWAKDANAAMASELARDYVREVYQESAHLATADKVPAAMTRRLNSNAGVVSLLQLAQRDPRVAASVDQFDQEREELNTPEGVVDLRTGEVSAPDPSRLVMRSTTVAPDWDCPTTKFDRFMAETFAGQPELGEYALNMLGISLLAGQDTQTFVLNYGEPASGKSTLMKLAQMILGKGDGGYSITCDHRMFEKSNNERHATEIAKLAGARMVVTSEIAEGKQLDADKFKMLVSGDRLSARFMHKDEFEFDPVFTLWVMSNHRAKAPSNEGAFWRRVKVLRYPHSVDESNRIDKLEQAIYDDEAPGVLADLIDRTRAFLEDGLWVPAAVLEETRAHRVDNDTVGGWVEDEVRRSDEGFVGTTDLYRSYQAWCKLHSAPWVERSAFRKALIEEGFVAKDTASSRGFRGLTLGSTALSPY